jgi:hypothetical protein
LKSSAKAKGAKRVTRKMRLRGMGMKRRWEGVSFSRDGENDWWEECLLGVGDVDGAGGHAG